MMTFYGWIKLYKKIIRHNDANPHNRNVINVKIINSKLVSLFVDNRSCTVNIPLIIDSYNLDDMYRFYKLESLPEKKFDFLMRSFSPFDQVKLVIIRTPYELGSKLEGEWCFINNGRTLGSFKDSSFGAILLKFTEFKRQSFRII